MSEIGHFTFSQDSVSPAAHFSRSRAPNDWLMRWKSPTTEEFTSRIASQSGWSQWIRVMQYLPISWNCAHSVDDARMQLSNMRLSSAARGDSDRPGPPPSDRLEPVS